MDDAPLFFGLQASFDLTKNEVLANLSAFKFWDKGSKKYVYIFPMDAYEQVTATLTRPVDFDEMQVRMACSRCPGMREEMTTEPYKGKGSFEVIVYPKVIQVFSWMNKKQVMHEIPLESLEAIWKCITKREIGERVRSRLIARAYCELLGFDRFFREKGSYDWQKFFGNRKDYIPFNLMLNVLRSWNVITYERTGYVTRLTDDLGLQSKLRGN